MKTLINKAVKHFGGQTALAKAIGVRQQDVWNWLNGKYKVAPKHAKRIDIETNGLISAHEFYPDLFDPSEK